MSSGPGPPPPGSAEEEQLRAAYEAELSRITSTEMIAQATVSLLNIGARRLGPPPGAGAEGPAPPERDLAQVRDAIDAVRALLEILERSIPGELGSLRDALSQLQMAYARAVQGASAEEAAAAGRGGEAPTGGESPAGGGGAPAGGAGAPQGGEQGRGPGPAESSGRLWVPGR